MSIDRFRIFLILFLLIGVRALEAGPGHSEFGPVVGLAVPFDRVANETANGTGFLLGLQGLYHFDQGDFRNLALEYGVDYTIAPSLRFSNVTLEGVSGSYRENIGILNVGGGLRHFLGSSSWRPYLGLRPGLYYLHRSGVSFRDRFGNPLPNPNLGNHFNFGLRIPIGISWKPSFRWNFSFGLQADVIFRNAGVVPGVSFPLSAGISF